MSSPQPDSVTVDTSEAHARALDARDPLAAERANFMIPPGPDGSPVAYFCGNSLGLCPRDARRCVEQELADWENLAVAAHFDGRTPWFAYHEVFNEPGARLVGARGGEVVVMNSLTTNLHLLMRTFFRPDGERRKIMIEAGAFPSDLFAVRSHLQTRGLDPVNDLIQVMPSADRLFSTDDFDAALERHGDETALVLVGGINYHSGQLLDMASITERAHRAGAIVGFDLAHAAGNVPLALHDWNVDFAAWCSYKYLNAGPGAIAAVFIHERHARNTSLPRYGGWWGVDPETRFDMHEADAFLPRATAEGWQLSNPPIMAMAPLRASLGHFDRVGMTALRAKSVQLTGYLESLLHQLAGDRVRILTPANPDQRGCQLSIRVSGDTRARQQALEDAGIVTDFRPPDIIRVAPVPLYNSWHDAWRLARALSVD